MLASDEDYIGEASGIKQEHAAFNNKPICSVGPFSEGQVLKSCCCGCRQNALICIQLQLTTKELRLRVKFKYCKITMFSM